MSLLNHIAATAAEQHGVDRQQFSCWLKAKLARAKGDGCRMATMEAAERTHTGSSPKHGSGVLHSPRLRHLP